MAGTRCFFVAEGGILLNEPDKTLVSPIGGDAEPGEVLARTGEAFAWLFGRLEGELEHDFEDVVRQLRAH
jgi:hypothetical protein